MCSDENGAPHAVRYLNAQLAVLYDNAKKCLEEHDQAFNEENRRFWALAAFRIQKAGTTEFTFDTVFDKPELEFVCNHDAILHITLVNSKILVKTSRIIGSNSHHVSLPTRLRLTYRLGFETRNIVETDQKNTGSTGTHQLIILNVKEAELLWSKSDGLQGVKPDVQKLLVAHMKEYFKLLHKTGSHVLYSLPQLGQRTSAMAIDFSVNSSAKTKYRYDSSTHIYHISVGKLNAYLSSVWLKSALLGRRKGAQVDWQAKCLAALDSSWIPDCDKFGKFVVEFDAPRVEVVCEREVIVYFTIRKIKFCLADSKWVEKEGWTIATMVNVLGVDSTKVEKKVTLDLASARYDHAASVYPGVGSDEKFVFDFQQIFVKFFTTKYLHIFHSSLQYIMHSVDIVETITTVKEDVEGTWRLIEVPDGKGTSPRRDTVQHAKMFGLDQIVAISQSSINSQFSALATYAKSIFRTWSYESHFDATFTPLTIRLLPRNRAIIWINIHEGHCKEHAQDGAAKSTFSGWSLAFEVELKMCSQDKLEGATSETYKKTLVYQEHGICHDRELKHVYLDLRNAEYLHEYSRFGVESPAHADCRVFLEKLQFVVHHLTHHYFAAICKDALHVISSIPVWKWGDSLPSYAFTSVDFQVYSTVKVIEHHHRHYWAHSTSGEEPIVVIFGMTDFRPLVHKHLECSTAWVVQGTQGFSHGTISISKRVFVEDHLLRLLSSVIEQTAFLPSTLPDKLSEYHGLKLLLWPRGHDKTGKDYMSHWKRECSTDCNSTLKYVWAHGDSSTRECRGNVQTVRSGVNCENFQYLELLKNSVKRGAPSLRIKIGGRTELTTEESTKTDMPLHKATCSVDWSITIVVETARGSGVKPYIEESSGPIFSDVVETVKVGDTTLFRNPKEMLQEAFPAEIDFNHFLDHFDSDAFEGAWQYCYPLATPYYLASPLFNDDGDLLFELRRHRGSSIPQPGSPRPGTPNGNDVRNKSAAASKAAPGVRQSTSGQGTDLQVAGAGTAPVN